jgi:hypothetical protein
MCDLRYGKKDNKSGRECQKRKPEKKTKEMPACITATCGEYNSHYLLQTHQLDATTRFTLEPWSYIYGKAEVIHVETQTYAPSHQCESEINMYLKATVLERIMGYDTIWRKSICSHANDGKGYMSVYRGPPLSSTS